jgi:hypothetical protein
MTGEREKGYLLSYRFPSRLALFCRSTFPFQAEFSLFLFISGITRRAGEG